MPSDFSTPHFGPDRTDDYSASCKIHIETYNTNQESELCINVAYDDVVPYIRAFALMCAGMVFGRSQSNVPRTQWCQLARACIGAGPFYRIYAHYNFGIRLETIKTIPLISLDCGVWQFFRRVAHFADERLHLSYLNCVWMRPYPCRPHTCSMQWMESSFAPWQPTLSAPIRNAFQMISRTILRCPQCASLRDTSTSSFMCHVNFFRRSASLGASVARPPAAPSSDVYV